VTIEEGAAAAEAARDQAAVLPAAETENVIQAATEGAINAVPLVACVAATLITFLALMAMLDALVQHAGSLVGLEGLTFTRMLGWLGWPLAFLMGVPPADCALVGELLGVKTAANEFVAYAHHSDATADRLPTRTQPLCRCAPPRRYARLSDAIAEGRLSHRAVVISSYALCGFANVGSMGIMVGGLSQMAPAKRSLLAKEVLRALVAGTLACFATACVASAVYDEVENASALQGSNASDAAQFCH
jgi:nucleoside permease NupC